MGLLGPAAAGCGATTPDAAPAPAAPTDEREVAPVAPPVDHVARGLMALADAHRRGWLAGHYGAAVLAGRWFAVDNALDARTTAALAANADAFIARSPAEFPEPDPGRGTADPARIVETLDRDIGELRSGGHNVIFATIALRALRERPDLATPAVVDGVCRLLDDFARSRPVSRSAHDRANPLPPYRDARDLAEVTLRATLRPWSHVRAVGASGVIHWATHAESLVSLAELGYAEVARRGHAAHQRQINLAVADDGRSAPAREPFEWRGPAYWESDAPRRLFGGTWLAGHAFKLPYSFFHLLRLTDDEELRAACLARATKLTIPFE